MFRNGVDMDREQVRSLIEQVAAEVDRRLARRDGSQAAGARISSFCPPRRLFPRSLTGV